jgi:hypothetical protein
MSVAAFYRHVLSAWRALSRQLWPSRPVDFQQRIRERLTSRLARLQQRMLDVRRRLERAGTLEAKKDRVRLELELYIAVRMNTPEAVAAALDLEQLQAALNRLREARKQLDGRYQRLRERFEAARLELARLRVES